MSTPHKSCGDSPSSFRAATVLRMEIPASISIFAPPSDIRLQFPVEPLAKVTIRIF